MFYQVNKKTKNTEKNENNNKCTFLYFSVHICLFIYEAKVTIQSRLKQYFFFNAFTSSLSASLKFSWHGGLKGSYTYKTAKSKHHKNFIKNVYVYFICI